MKTTERLEALLDEKDARIEELEEQLHDANLALELDYEWTRHVEVNDDKLPVPRLEMRWKKLNDDEWEATYSLVYQHLLGEHIAVPMGKTGHKGTRLTRERMMNDDGKITLPFRDGVHIRHDMKTLRLPGFVILEELVQTLEPLP